jgi:hypothetical protein
MHHAPFDDGIFLVQPYRQRLAIQDILFHLAFQ